MLKFKDATYSAAQISKPIAKPARTRREYPCYRDLPPLPEAIS